MKICFVRKKYSMFGGAERYLDSLIDSFNQKGFEIHVIAEEWNETKPRENVIIHPVKIFKMLSVLSVMSFNKNAQKVLAELNPEIILNCERVVSPGWYRAGDGCHRAYLERKSIGMNNLEKNIMMANPLHQTILGIEKQLFLKADYILANSRMVEGDIEKYYPEVRNKIVVVYNAIPGIKRYMRIDKTIREHRRQEINVNRYDTLFLFVGSGFKRKGVKTIIESASILKQKHHKTPFKIMIVGKDDVDKYRDYAEKLKVADVIIFTGPRPDPVTDYIAADVFVLPTQYDPCSNATLEALAAGCYVITTDANGASELIKKNISGEVLPLPVDSEGLANSMESQLSRYRRDEEVMDIMKTVEDLTIEHYVDMLIAMLLETRRKKQ